MGDIVTKDKFGKMHSYKPHEMAAQARLDDQERAVLTVMLAPIQDHLCRRI